MSTVSNLPNLGKKGAVLSRSGKSAWTSRNIGVQGLDKKSWPLENEIGTEWDSISSEIEKFELYREIRLWHQTWKKSPESIFRVDMCPRCPTCLIWVKKVQFYPDRAKVHGHQEISVSRGWTKNLGRSRMRLERNEIQSHPKLKNLNCIGKLDFDIRHERKVQNLFLGWTCVHGVQLA